MAAKKEKDNIIKDTRNKIKKIKTKKVSTFEKVAAVITKFTGSGPAFTIALAFVIVWAVTGPIFDYSETWQLVINTGTTIITFLMVFIIQHSQNKDSLALQLKLDELIYSMGGASNELVDAENLCEEDLKALREHYAKISEIRGRGNTKELPKKNITGKNSKAKTNNN
jgi:low affinity Fe/Cu permease